MKKKLIFICGLCVIENEAQTLKVARYLKKITSKYPEVDFYFKASYDKANRTSIDSFRGVGFRKGKEILGKVKNDLNIKILTDVHSIPQAIAINNKYNWIDVLQIPAFLCRQTDLVKAIADTNSIVNIKKGQFIAPEDVKYIIEKIESTGNKNIMITERGTCFGYRDLIVDYRSFIKLKKYGYPVIFDATHSQQKPSADKGQSGGTPEYTRQMILGAIATGVDGIFMEVHPNPSKAKSDSATSLYLEDVDIILKQALEIKKLVSKY